MKTRISIEEILELTKRRQEINRIPLHDIEFTLNGEVVNISEKVIDEFIYYGLSNFDFITGKYFESKE